MMVIKKNSTQMKTIFTEQQHRTDMDLHERKTPEHTVPDYKIAVFGGEKVGKTCVIQRFIDGVYSEDYVRTISEVYESTLRRKDKVVANLTIYDTAGSIHFPVMDRLTIAKASACIIMFSVKSMDSLKKADRLLKEVNRVRKNNACPCVVVGNKSDIGKFSREVTFEQGVQFAVKYSCSYLEISAKNNANVKEVFDKVLKKILYFKIIQNSKEEKKTSFKARALSFKSIFA